MRMKLILGCVLLIAAFYKVEAAGTSCNCGWINKGRIIGGDVVAKNKYPWITSLEEIPDPWEFCGGAIVSPWHIITAAHCTHKKGVNDIQVRVGAHDLRNSGKVYKVAAIHNHEKYDHDSSDYDIALIVTASKIAFSQIVGPVCLPGHKQSIAGEKVLAMGWGNTSPVGDASSVLREVQLDVMPYSECQKAWLITKSYLHLCTYTSGKDTCQRDSGGPLTWLDKSINRYVLAAVVSYGDVCAGSLPGVNTDVSLFLDWINSKIEATKPGNAACRKL